MMVHARKSIFIFTIFISLLVSTACENSEREHISEQQRFDQVQTQQQDLKGNKNIKIGFSMDTLAEDRWLRDRALFRESVESLGIDITILASQGDDALQISQAETLIHEGIDLLVVVPHNAESTAAIVKKAHAAGIKVLSYDRLVKNSEIDFYVSYDNKRVGELQAEAITKLVPKGNYVYIGGPETDNNALLFKEGVFNILQPLIDKGDIKVVYDQWSKDWLTENAMKNMEEALEANNNKIDAVIAANDATAGVAIQALEEKGMAGKIPVAGQDADLAAIQRIVMGTQTMTVYKPIKPLTITAAEIAVKLAKGENVKHDRIINNGKSAVPSIILTPQSINIDNIDETIIADGFHTREEVYQE